VPAKALGPGAIPTAFAGHDPAPVAGIDEVGRGCLFGPVLAAAVVLPAAASEPLQRAGLTDSKQLTARRRAALVPVIHRWALDWGLGQASVAVRSRSHPLQLALGEALALDPPLPLPPPD
jgi:ribonuclease HII